MVKFFDFTVSTPLHTDNEVRCGNALAIGALPHLRHQGLKHRRNQEF